MGEDDNARMRSFNVGMTKLDPFYRQITLICGHCETPWVYTVSALGGESLRKVDDGPDGD